AGTRPGSGGRALRRSSRTPSGSGLCRARWGPVVADTSQTGRGRPWRRAPRGRQTAPPVSPRAWSRVSVQIAERPQPLLELRPPRRARGGWRGVAPFGEQVRERCRGGAVSPAVLWLARVTDEMEGLVVPERRRP